VEASQHLLFDHFDWTFFPPLITINAFIAIEEAQLLRREQAIAEGLPDPGRPPYQASYGNLADWNDFHVHFSYSYPFPSVSKSAGPQLGAYRTQITSDASRLPPLPPHPLPLHPNAVIMARGGALATMDLSEADIVRF
jgi:hypothetical protein